MASTTCGHVYCYTCIVNCIKVTRKCPSCRKALDQKKARPGRRVGQGTRRAGRAPLGKPPPPPSPRPEGPQVQLL
ncbi:MAG: hypothetical protein J3K34DRAFT_431869 [Monoraphidium minutum]|nr:MAG: hypothetical protein J3K34DRAFT_431869 [Monoraphidium minutum]